MDEKINVGINVESGDVKQLDIQFKKVDQTVNQIIDHLTQVENKILNITKNVNKITNNTYNSYNNKKGTFVDNNLDTIVGAGGVAVSTTNTRKKSYRQAADDIHDYQQEQIRLLKEQVETEKQITKLKAEQARLAGQDSYTRLLNAEAKKETAAYRNSIEHLTYEEGLGIKHRNLAGWYAAKSKDPDKFLAGGLNRNWRYQGGMALQALGATTSGAFGYGGKIAGSLLDTAGAFLKGPAVGARTAVSDLVKVIKELGSAAVTAYTDIEAIKTQLGVVFSNQTQANATFGQISEYAVHSPFGVQQTSELAVLLKQSGVYASDLMDTLKMLGDTAGGNMEKMKRIANNYAQIVSIGKASMLDMRQFAYAGIPIFEAVSKELNVSQQELRKLISDGKVTSDIIEKVFKDLTGINGIFENATEKGAKTLKARLQNLSDARQLAMGEVGERIVKFGDNGSRQSYVEKIVTSIEGFWQWVREHNDIKNIERDVNKIATSNSEIKKLETLLQYAKDSGDKNLQRVLKEEIEYQTGRVSYDYQRDVLAQSYDVKMASYNRYRSMYGEMNQEDIERKKWEYEIASMNAVQDFPQTFLEMQDMYAQLIEDLDKYSEAIKKAETVTEEENEANMERNLLEAQQLAFDQTNKYSDSAGSLTSQFRELSEIYKNSDEYKEKQEAERNSLLKDALEVLKVIAKKTDDLGRVDVTKFSATELYKLNRQGAFTASKKRNLVPKNGNYNDEDRALLASQYGYMQDLLVSYLTPIFSSNSKTANKDTVISKLINNSIGNLAELTNEEFYSQFKNVEKNTTNIIDDIITNVKKEFDPSKAGGIISMLEIFKDDFKTILDELEIDTTGEKVTAAMMEASGDVFIPLWKRIFAQNTGLTTQSMTTQENTLQNYMKDMAPRQIVAGVMKAAMQTMGIDSATRLLKPSERAIQLQGTDKYINQVDWERSKKALQDFATQLSASTSVVSAYREGLEKELENLQNLIVQGATETESQDLEKQKLVSVKTLSKLSTEAGTQLVNALGDKLETEDGLKVSVVDGEFVDEQGNKVAIENLHVTDSINDIIAEYLPQIQQELAEARVAERNNEEFNKWLKQVLPSELANGVLGLGGDASINGFLLSNEDYLTDQFNNAFDAVLADYLQKDFYKSLSGVSKEDIISMALQDQDWVSAREAEGMDVGQYVKARNIFLEVLEAVKDAANELGSEEFKNLTELARNATRDEAVRSRLAKLMGIPSSAQLSPSAWGDEGGYDMKSQLVKALTGVEKGYTMDDLYKGAANGGYLSEADRDALKFKETLQDTLDIMKDMGVATADLVGQLSQKAFLTPFEKMGECLITGEKWTEKTADAMEELGAEALSALGPIMAKAGFELVARGALNNSWGMIAGGLALAAAGGFASGIGGALTEGQKETKDNKQVEKLQNLKDQLADLLDQARRDALYYENNLRHKTALGMNKEFDYQSVNDAVITPGGDVIKTDPKDYLIATKTPNQLMGSGNVSVAPVINCIVNNNSSAHVTQQQQQNPDGSIDIITIIEDKFGEYIASPKSDDAFASREYRIRGQQAIMN